MSGEFTFSFYVSISPINCKYCKQISSFISATLKFPYHQADLSSTGHREPSKVDKMIDLSACPNNFCLFEDIKGELGAQQDGEASDVGRDEPKVSVLFENAVENLVLQ